MKDILGILVGQVRHDLRDKRQESVYRTSKESGLRPETIRKIEGEEIKGSAGALGDYIDSYCSRFPSSAYRIFYNLSITVAQSNINFNS